MRKDVLEAKADAPQALVLGYRIVVKDLRVQPQPVVFGADTCWRLVLVTALSGFVGQVEQNPLFPYCGAILFSVQKAVDVSYTQNYLDSGSS